MLKERQGILLQSIYLFISVLIFLELSLGAIFFLRSAFVYLSFPYDITTPESQVVYPIYLSIKGIPLYENPCNFPHRINIYTPIYYLISTFFAKMFNLTSYLSILVLCRTITFVSSLMCSIIIFGITRQLKYNNPTNLFASLLFLGNPLLFGWGFNARVDLMAILYSLLALYMLLLGKGRMSLFLSVTFALLAFYTKQPYVNISIAIIIYLILRRRWQTAMEFAIYFFGIGSIIFFWLNYITRGAAYLNLITTITTIPHRLFNFIDILGIVWWKILPNFILIIMAMRILKDIHLLIKIYAIITITMSAVSSSRLGAGENFWLEVLPASVLIMSPIIHKLFLKRNKIIVGFMLLPLVLFPYSRFGIAWLRGRFASDIEGSRPNKEMLIEIAKRAKGFIIYDFSLDVLIYADKLVINTNWPQYGYMVKNSICSDSHLISMIENREFGCIIFTGDYESHIPEWLLPKMKGSIRHNYTLNRRISDKFIYIPKEQY